MNSSLKLNRQSNFHKPDGHRVGQHLRACGTLLKTQAEQLTVLQPCPSTAPVLFEGWLTEVNMQDNSTS